MEMKGGGSSVVVDSVQGSQPGGLKADVAEVMFREDQGRKRRNSTRENSISGAELS